MVRDLFSTRIKKGLIGPGSDEKAWGLDNSEEIISDYPLVRYFTGILFPEKVDVITENGEDEESTKAETEEPDVIIEEAQGYFDTKDDEASEESIDEQKIKKGNQGEIENKTNQNHFNPNSIGLTFCISKFVSEFEVVFSGGFYYEPKQEEIKIKMPEEGLAALNYSKSEFPFKDILSYENGFLSLKRKLKGETGGKKPRSGEYLQMDEYKRTDAFLDSEAKFYIHYFERLTRRTWKRREFKYKTNIFLGDTTSKNLEIKIPENSFKEISIGYHLKKYQLDDNNYVRIQLVNLAKQSSRRFTNKTPELNQKCLFQVSIQVESNGLLPFKSNQELNPFDTEVEELNLLYRNIKSYGIGHNCSVTWNDACTTVQTTFLPEYNIKDTKNDFQESDFINLDDFKKLNSSLGIKNLSIFSKSSKTEVQNTLTQFVDLYGDWIKTQKVEQTKLSDNDQKVSTEILKRLDNNYDRLKTNINCLNDELCFKAFRLANTAMLIQIIISNDNLFSKLEKEVSEINNLVEYDSLTFFEQYDYLRLENGEPKYRPFQLAFLILSLKGVTEPQSEDRKKIVDLIWFPTGGGKTEAYLAVTAFTIIYRRLAYDEEKSKGVSVIMRYTLRLLTSQQFERSSKLTSALEFLRKNFVKELKTEPISIGLWVGNQLTPGTIEDAGKRISEIEDECCKKDGRPETKNPFQISACPWCGTKLISEGSYGFTIEKKSLKIHCLNKRCTFYKGIPVQVVDESLFKQPPTILFATVDKFAQIAWKEDAHKFFNSLDLKKLPPDLIIQDELHLLSGPLGSIVGIFESVVEKLCTNETMNLMPKIIASTATTRNTKQQVERLYGGRSVNIFPPSGLSYDDSFFARESKAKSRRKYIGFMPVGKASVDTQLYIIAHLLVARIENGEPDDNYWTLVSYYNTLKDVGKVRNKVGDEILYNTKQLQSRVLGNNSYSYNHYGLEARTKELTARVDSSEIKTVLKQLEHKFELIDRVSKTGEATKFVNASVVDLVLATNMFSVGIDIGRLNVMLMNGMPKNIAEYIQASSRVGRKADGLVVTLLDPNRARDKSYFEHFIPFHQSFYKSIEPLSITPFTVNTIDKMLTTIMVAFLRHKLPELNKDNAAQNFQQGSIKKLKSYLKERFGENEYDYDFFESRIDFLANDWKIRVENGLRNYSELLKRPTDSETSEKDDWVIMQSMREVDADTFVEIKQTFAVK